MYVQIPLGKNRHPKDAGMLPIRQLAARFAVGLPVGNSTNSWKIWVDPKGDIYVTCRDNFRETKISLHVSDTWRMGFREKAIEKRPTLIGEHKDRIWEKWKKPIESAPGVIMALHLFFPPSELIVRPELRKQKDWRGVIFIEPAPPGNVTVATLFICEGEKNITFGTSPGFCLAAMKIDESRVLQVIVHEDPEGQFPLLIERGIEHARREARQAGINLPDEACVYLWGRKENDARFVVVARVKH
jgi:hypothetical protein